ncbi:unnamed protein product, partial [Mesorhabditis spiculigera]
MPVSTSAQPDAPETDWGSALEPVLVAAGIVLDGAPVLPSRPATANEWQSLMVPSSINKLAVKRYEGKKYATFSPEAISLVGADVSFGSEHDKFTNTGRLNELGFMMKKTENRLVKTMLHAHGFMQCSPKSRSFNLFWSSGHVPPEKLRDLQPWQRVNHFPRSFLITYKHYLYDNISLMRRQFGEAYDFIPEYYVTPRDYDLLVEEHEKNEKLSVEPTMYIVKPVDGCQGRGIFFTDSPNDIPLEQKMLVSKYIDNPLLLDGHKFDLRVYVAVTSFNPLICYVYSGGMTRLASEKYLPDVGEKAEFVHLTNYSLNKDNQNYIKNDTFMSEDVGHKRTLGALLRRLEDDGIDSELLMVRIEDLIIKTLLSGQDHIATWAKNTFISPDNAFQLYGFDILVDENLKPWLLEVNISPSLKCDAPLDSVLKSKMLSDLLNLACIPLVNRNSRGRHSSRESVGHRHVKKKSKQPNYSHGSPECITYAFKKKLELEDSELMKRSSIGGYDKMLYASLYGSLAAETKADSMVQWELMRPHLFPARNLLSQGTRLYIGIWAGLAVQYSNKINEDLAINVHIPSVRASCRLRTDSYAAYAKKKADLKREKKKAVEAAKASTEEKENEVKAAVPPKSSATDEPLHERCR